MSDDWDWTTVEGLTELSELIEFWQEHEGEGPEPTIKLEVGAQLIAALRERDQQITALREENERLSNERIINDIQRDQAHVDLLAEISSERRQRAHELAILEQTRAQLADLQRELFALRARIAEAPIAGAMFRHSGIAASEDELIYVHVESAQYSHGKLERVRILREDEST